MYYILYNPLSSNGKSVKSIDKVKELLEKADDETKAKVNAFADALRANGVTVEEISCDLFEIANTAWQILMSAETTNNLSRFDGVKYGYRTPNYTNIDELYTNSRTESFGYLLKSTVLFGSETLSEDSS